ncbi:hypothetical protein Y032_0722g1836 [Ancylostoma ceylanicum]|uniref:PiggyBac transposable element-derived protein domain-containing protein n=1 Tax=Ancylostoma ceylanicum TaxID=53326 RepID=A0A016WFE8_9BILA|nr:hypothetical protein Y032_0722g1836 [Ancylostoma ceylanicum]
MLHIFIAFLFINESQSKALIALLSSSARDTYQMDLQKQPTIFGGEWTLVNKMVLCLVCIANTNLDTRSKLWDPKKRELLLMTEVPLKLVDRSWNSPEAAFTKHLICHNSGLDLEIL